MNKLLKDILEKIYINKDYEYFKKNVILKYDLMKIFTEV